MTTKRHPLSIFLICFLSAICGFKSAGSSIIFQLENWNFSTTNAAATNVLRIAQVDDNGPYLDGNAFEVSPPIFLAITNSATNAFAPGIYTVTPLYGTNHGRWPLFFQADSTTNLVFFTNAWLSGGSVFVTQPGPQGAAGAGLTIAAGANITVTTNGGTNYTIIGLPPYNLDASQLYQVNSTNVGIGTGAPLTNAFLKGTTDISGTSFSGDLQVNGTLSSDANKVSSDGSGHLTAISFIGSGASLTALSPANLTPGGNLPALNAINLTNTVQKTGNTIWVDAVNGNDSTGVRGDSGHPFATIGYASPYLYQTIVSTPSGAIGVAQAGDVIKLRPGSFTNTYVVLPPNVSLIGEAPSDTIIFQDATQATPLLSVGPAITPGSNSVIANLTIQCLITNNYAAPIGVNDNPTLYNSGGHPSTNYTVSPATGVRILNCILIGSTDGNYVNSTNANNLRFENCRFISGWDTDALISTNTFDEFFNCDFLPTYASYTGSPGLAHGSATQAGTNRFVGCRFYSVGGTNANECIHLYTGAAYVYATACVLSTVSSNATAITADAGNVSIDACRINSPTNWNYTTNSAVTNLYSTVSIASSNVFRGTIYADAAGATNLAAGNLASGTVPTARLGSGTANSSSFLRGDQTWAAAGSGTVTSVAMTGDGTVFQSSVTGSPISISGTFAPSLVNVTSNTFLAGPKNGSASAPTFRALDVTDFGPLLSATHSNVTASRFISYTNGAAPTITTNGIVGIPSGTKIFWTNIGPSDQRGFFAVVGNNGSCTNFFNITYGLTHNNPLIVRVDPANDAARALMTATGFVLSTTTNSTTGCVGGWGAASTFATGVTYLFQFSTAPE